MDAALIGLGFVSAAFWTWFLMRSADRPWERLLDQQERLQNRQAHIADELTKILAAREAQYLAFWRQIAKRSAEPGSIPEQAADVPVVVSPHAGNGVEFRRARSPVDDDLDHVDAGEI